MRGVVRKAKGGRKDKTVSCYRRTRRSDGRRFAGRFFILVAVPANTKGRLNTMQARVIILLCIIDLSWLKCYCGVEVTRVSYGSVHGTDDLDPLFPNLA